MYGGDGLARSEGRVVLTPFVLPGERIEASLQRAKNVLWRGKPGQILQPAAQRTTPDCPYFFRCGGCHYQHATYEAQTQQKKLILLEVLRRVGHIQFDGEVGLVTGDPWHYRNRTQLHIHKGKAGYYAAGSHEVVAIDHCPISSPKLNEAIGVLARDLAHYRWFDATVELFTNETDVQVNVLDRVPGSVMPLFESIGGGGPIEAGAFRVSPNSFFQVNRFLVDRLVEAVTGVEEGDSVVDLYAGVGLFSRALIGRFREIRAVESGGSAFRDLQFNLDRAGLRDAAIRMTTEDYLTRLTAAPQWVLADPPRPGLGKIATRELLRLRPPRITIVSCDPATLARDLRELTQGGYNIGALTLVDLFPQTFHLETVVELRA